MGFAPVGGCQRKAVTLGPTGISLASCCFWTTALASGVWADVASPRPPFGPNTNATD